MEKRSVYPPEDAFTANRWYKSAAFAFDQMVELTPGIKVTVEDTYHLPAGGPFILALTHHNSWDVPALGAVIYKERRRPVHFIAKKELLNTEGASITEQLRHPAKEIGGRLVRKLYALPVNREGGAMLEQVKPAYRLLEGGKILGIAPEGGRVNGNKLGELEPGVGRIAVRTNTEIIPVAIAGKNRFSALIPRSLHIVFGRSIDSNDFTGDKKSKSSAIDEKLSESLQSLLDRAYEVMGLE